MDAKERQTKPEGGRITARGIAYIALGAALIAVCSWISVPIEVPFTMQTFAVCLIAALLGAKMGTGCVAVYLLLGLAGLPVFAGFKGGPAALLGVTGGYLIGFLFTALIVGLAADRLGRKPAVLAAAMAAGVLLCYTFGTAWFVIVYTRKVGAIGVGTALMKCVVPYLIPDGIKIALAALLTRRLEGLIHRE